jgi:hypothetical protein
MERNRTKIHIFSRSLGRKLVLGAILSLLSFHQSWAAVVCLCHAQRQPRAEACDYKYHCASPSAMSHGPGVWSSTANLEIGIAMFSADRGTPSSGAVMCCSQPPSAFRLVATILVQESPTVAPELPRIDLGYLTRSASPHILSPPRSRPLYLALSCLLI